MRAGWTKERLMAYYVLTDREYERIMECLKGIRQGVRVWREKWISRGWLWIFLFRFIHSLSHWPVFDGLEFFYIYIKFQLNYFAHTISTGRRDENIGKKFPISSRIKFPAEAPGKISGPTPATFSPAKKKEYKNINCIVPFRNKAFPCSVLSYISQHRIEFRYSDVQSANSIRLLIAIMFLRKWYNFYFSIHRNGSRCFKMKTAFCKNCNRYQLTFYYLQKIKICVVIISTFLAKVFIPKKTELLKRFFFFYTGMADTI